MALASGTRLGPYEILALIGSGGMGEVYRAHDPRLVREVAIKVLPVEFSGDVDRLRRFEQEARASAALNHPNILAIYDLGTHDGQPYIVSELLEGHTLRTEMAGSAPSVKRAIDYAIQTCRGLAAAHERGIVHRDLKPENLFVTRDGHLKILDFGLAKLTEKAGAGAAVGATVLATRATDPSVGVVLGTVGYMSPEQVRGQAVDQRTDIFSLGVVLYELLSGGRPFAADTTADTISAILIRDPPELTVGGSGSSAALDRITRHCLEKAPERRFQSAADVAFALETVSVATEPHMLGHHPGQRFRWVTLRNLSAVALVGALIGGAGVWSAVRRGLGSGTGTASLINVTRLTHDVGFSDWPTWSPDGKYFAFSSSKSGNFEIYVRRVEGGEDVNVTRDPGDDVQPAFSPDGTSIAFASTRSSKTRLIKSGTLSGSYDFRVYGGDIWVTPSLGGRARRLAEDGNAPIWRPDGRSITYVSGAESHRSILEVSTDGGLPKSVLASRDSEWEIIRLRYSYDARTLIFETADRRLFALTDGGGKPQELLHGKSPVWDSTSGRMYYINDAPAGGGRLLATTVTSNGATVSVASTPDSVGILTGWFRDLAISPDGRGLLASEVDDSLSVMRLPVPVSVGKQGPEEALDTSGQVRDQYPSVSRDGRRLLVSSNRLGSQDLWLLDLESRGWERVPTPCQSNTGSWMPDGRHVLDACFNDDGTFSVWIIALDGSATRELVSHKLIHGVTASFLADASSDGLRIVYAYTIHGFSQLFVLDVTSGAERQLTTSRTDKFDGRWSPDGQWIAFSANGDGAMQLWRVRSSGADEQVLTSGYERMRHVFYSPDGRWIYVQPSHRNIYRLPADGGPMQRVTDFPESGLFIEEPMISPDGKYFVYARSHGGSSLWLLTLGTTPATPSKRAP